MSKFIPTYLVLEELKEAFNDVENLAGLSEISGEELQAVTKVLRLAVGRACVRLDRLSNENESFKCRISELNSWMEGLPEE